MNMMRRLLSVLPLLLVAAGCASAPPDQDRPADIARPEILFAQRGQILFGGGDTAPVKLDIQVRNRARVPLLVREVEVSSPQMITYGILRSVRAYNETIPPGETRTLEMIATAETSSTDRRAYDEPLSIRAMVRFEANGVRFREVVSQAVIGHNR